jgi:5-methylcytosine-specific restriction endonuclease McrA
MSPRLLSPCSQPGCPHIAVAAGRCLAHKRPAWQGTRPYRPAGGRPWQRTRQRILERDNHCCRYCGAPAQEVDHIVNRARGGDDSDENLVACCKPCNERKRQQEARAGREAKRR